MLYLDGSSRKPEDALGYWVDKEDPKEISHLRFQSGYFSLSGLGAFAGIIKSLNTNSNKISAVIGANEKETIKDDVESYLDLVKSPRKGVNTAIVSFSNGLFHPKVYHLTRSDGSEIAYVGSANLTSFGINSGNIEAGLIVDTRKGDQKAILAKISASIDTWLGSTTIGSSVIKTNADVAKLVTDGIIGVAKTPRTSASGGAKSSTAKKPPLSPLLTFGPLLKKGKTTTAAPAGPTSSTSKTTAAPSAAHSLPGFVMTLQKTDVGVGQTSTGTSRRSPEIFVPLGARDMNPGFWSWPGAFVADAGWSGSIDQNGFGKMDRTNVRIRLGGTNTTMNMWYNPDKRDLRLRSEELRSSGSIGDILRIEKVSGAGYDYYIEIVPTGTTQHPVYLAKCVESVRAPSKKKFGYY